MTVWYQLSTFYNQRRVLRTVVLLMLCVALITTLFFADASFATPGTTKTVNFQGRLSTASGAVVPDGNYNIQFKIYQDGSGTTAGNPDGTLKWTESYINNGGTSGVEVRNGFFSVALGSLTPFGTSVDWNQDTLWLSMNVAGNAAGCTTFGSSPCTADGEMLSMKRITATPYALNSGTVGGKSANELAQLGQGVQTDASTNSSIFINKTGTGNLIQLQAGGTDAFTLNNTGSISLGSAANQSLSVATATSGAGKSLTVTAGAAASGSAQMGGDLVLQGGAGDGSATSGNVVVKANDADSTGTFQVQNTAGKSILSVDTINNTVSSGSINLASAAAGASADVSMWTDTTTPSIIDSGDDGNLELGTKFRSSVTGRVTGVKFYKSAANTGTHIGNLWSSNGTKLATVTFTGETSSGWQYATFASPVYITANTTYIISYFAPAGRFSKDPGYFGAAHTNGPLTALQSGTDGDNGVYAYSSNSTFPTDPSGSGNYWVDVIFQPDTDKISSTNELVISSSGAMTVGPTTQALKLQGSAIDIGATNGGNVSIQGGAATVNNGNGGSILLSGGAGVGTGATGLVVLTTPTFSTATTDANCYAGGVTVSSDCTVTQSSVDNSSAVVVGFNTTGRTATLPDPTIKTAGRIMYIMAAADSQDFTLSINGGGPSNLITVRRNTTVTIISNGTNWSVAGGSNLTTLQDAYTNTPQNAAGSDIVVSDDGTNTGGLTIQDSNSNPVNGALLEVKNANSGTLFSVNSNKTEYAADGKVNDDTNFTTNWSASGTATVTRNTTDGQEASDSAEVAADTAAGNGVRNKLQKAPAASTRYHVSVYAKLTSGTAFSDMQIRYSPDGGTTFADCVDYNSQNVITAGWTQITCNIDTPATTATSPYVYFIQPTAAASARTYLIDNFEFNLGSAVAPNVQIGSGANNGSDPTTLFTLDKAGSAPTTDNNDDSLLGSMYYDTTLGKLQCFEADGWGECGSRPDIFVTMSPEYANAVKHSDNIGTLTSDLCSDTLNINDGSASQPTICSTNETYNFYKWTSPEATTQTNSIYVTYHLPATFKQFVTDSTSLLGRTDSTDASVTYQIYRNHAGNELTACGSAVSVSTGTQSSWQTAIATGSADPSACGFVAGDSIVVQINQTASNNAKAYVSSLGFIFNNN